MKVDEGRVEVVDDGPDEVGEAEGGQGCGNRRPDPPDRWHARTLLCRLCSGRREVVYGYNLGAVMGIAEGGGT